MAFEKAFNDNPSLLLKPGKGDFEFWQAGASGDLREKVFALEHRASSALRGSTSVNGLPPLGSGVMDALRGSPTSLGAAPQNLRRKTEGSPLITAPSRLAQIERRAN